MTLSAPFPYFGGKSRAAPLVWERFGDVRNYVEPFCGSAAMLLAAPDAEKRTETINDLDGFVANFWRAVRGAPDEVARHADYPVIEADLEARHAWLVNRSERLRWQLEDPDFYDAKIAGWWVWGACAWIGSGWCAGSGPHMTTGSRIYDKRESLSNAGRGINRKIPHLGDAGQGINRQIPHLGDAGQGINRQIPHLGDAGQGINRQIPHLSNAGRGINRKIPHLSNAGRGDFILSWMNDLAARLRDVRVTNGDWLRVLSNSVTARHGLTAVFLDPPYAKGTDYAVGGVGTGLSHDVAEWCAENGDNPKMRIALCGHGDEHDMPEGWTAETWKARSGYATSKAATDRRKSETIWFSPHCVREPDFALVAQ